jgi:hypothetical protein
MMKNTHYTITLTDTDNKSLDWHSEWMRMLGMQLLSLNFDDNSVSGVGQMAVVKRVIEKAHNIMLKVCVE